MTLGRRLNHLVLLGLSVSHADGPGATPGEGTHFCSSSPPALESSRLHLFSGLNDVSRVRCGEEIHELVPCRVLFSVIMLLAALVEP